MAEVRFRICDRCGERLNTHVRQWSIVKLPPRIVRIAWIVCGVTVNHDKELCGPCTDKLELFMKGESPQ